MTEPTFVDPGAVYDGAPSILQEVGWVLRHTRPSGSQNREFWLRKAAVFDRIALQQSAVDAPDLAQDSVTTAEGAAQQLVQFDADHGRLSLKGSELIDGNDHREYVRHEYRAWSRVQSL
ncbi:hypothetical protein ACIHFE_14005 [Streptomyces sp. NPDC052396]|uniref:hypothetical protein n=1 Tax=Streptomyces sp. NPDC052396 TaxID=3365689 RepID=UPI0037D70227